MKFPCQTDPRTKTLRLEEGTVWIASNRTSASYAHSYKAARTETRTHCFYSIRVNDRICKVKSYRESGSLTKFGVISRLITLNADFKTNATKYPSESRYTKQSGYRIAEECTSPDKRRLHPARVPPKPVHNPHLQSSQQLTALTPIPPCYTYPRSHSYVLTTPNPSQPRKRAALHRTPHPRWQARFLPQRHPPRPHQPAPRPPR